MMTVVSEKGGMIKALVDNSKQENNKVVYVGGLLIKGAECVLHPPPPSR